MQIFQQSVFQILQFTIKINSTYHHIWQFQHQLHLSWLEISTICSFKDKIHLLMIRQQNINKAQELLKPCMLNSVSIFHCQSLHRVMTKLKELLREKVAFAGDYKKLSIIVTIMARQQLKLSWIVLSTLPVLDKEIRK